MYDIAQICQRGHVINDSSRRATGSHIASGNPSLTLTAPDPMGKIDVRMVKNDAKRRNKVMRAGRAA